MKLLNEFLNKAKSTGKLSITHHRAGGVTPNTEVAARKIANLVHDKLPEVEIISAPLRSVPAGDHSPVVLWARAVAEAARGRVPQEFRGEPELLDAFAELRAIALGEFAEFPGAQSIAGGIASAMSGDIDCARAVDSVVANSYADARALMTFAKTAGNRRAIEMAVSVAAHRRSGGDFGRFSNFSQSADTEGALRIVGAELRSGATYSALGISDLQSHALSVATQGAGMWMGKRGVDPDVCDAVSETIGALAEQARARSAATLSPGRPRQAAPA